MPSESLVILSIELFVRIYILVTTLSVQGCDVIFAELLKFWYDPRRRRQASPGHNSVLVSVFRLHLVEADALAVSGNSFASVSQGFSPSMNIVVVAGEGQSLSHSGASVHERRQKVLQLVLVSLDCRVDDVGLLVENAEAGPVFVAAAALESASDIAAAFLPLSVAEAGPVFVG
eukprot:CAMPEP_0197521862 /NCGR_PEP_ID=MMETSP1318-20131121/7085_2 /TAXON_ID=552666 /ORGANISM="Partenskyella glossopodia, Strain RCC365" /LENGTH=173 /DNA_ID=CAMNT_0043074013 /DNA_START=274 /DNA_END=792 /DNA_ORIENTATION=-